ncbi:MAG: DUF1801 domain-containing protein [Bacteroidales bacterium]
MANQTNKLNEEVTDFLNACNHPFRNEIERVRICILSANYLLQENIKWNSPNYSINGEDRITMRIHPPRMQLQLIFHRGAKKQEQPKNKLISSKSKLLIWKENDRAIITIKNSAQIENAQAELIEIINAWIAATS